MRGVHFVRTGIPIIRKKKPSHCQKEQNYYLENIDIFGCNLFLGKP